MKCLYCGCIESRVVDSRQSEDATTIRRRRECMSCGRRFTTYEKIDTMPLVVVKKDKSRQNFDSQKLRRGIVKACEKRPVSSEQIDQLVRRVELQASNRFDQEITSERIGEIVMAELKNLDEVAYVRFASVYRQFQDVQTFMDELHKLLRSAEPGSSDGNPPVG